MPAPIPVVAAAAAASSPGSSSNPVEPPPPYTNNLPQGNRPALPYRARNRILAQAPTAGDPDALVVKFQTIVREEREIVVGRLKIATNNQNEHAFILRRYDTGAISVTTMYKAAFPTASQEEEDREMRWIKSTFDLTGMNGGRGNTAVKLAGNWIPPALATHLAPAYKLVNWIHAMVEANPEAGVAYRKSQRSQAAAEEAAQRRANGSTTPTAPATPAAAPAAAASSPRTTRGALRGSPAPGSPAAKRQRTEAAAPTAGSSSAATRSNAAAPAPAAQAAPAGDVEMDNGETVAVTVQSVTEIVAPANIAVNAEAEAAESRAMVARLTAEYQARSAAGQSAEDMGLVEPAASGSTVRGVKRTVEESQAGEAVSISGGEAVTVTTDGTETEGRLIRGNKRVVNAEVAQRRNAYWGPAFLAIGAGLGIAISNYLL